MEHYERHCPPPEQRYNCLIPHPLGYKIPIRWLASRDEVWKANIPHTHLAQEKSDQNWMVVNGDKVNFPGGGTHFHDEANKYIVAISREEAIIGVENLYSLWIYSLGLHTDTNIKVGQTKVEAIIGVENRTCPQALPPLGSEVFRKLR
ncbi:hypothetical protein ACFX15_029601 [Malus domestica]